MTTTYLGNSMFTCFNGGSQHGHKCNEYGCQEVQGREEEMDLDWAIPFGVFPTEPGNAEDRQADAHLKNVVDIYFCTFFCPFKPLDINGHHRYRKCDKE